MNQICLLRLLCICCFFQIQQTSDYCIPDNTVLQSVPDYVEKLLFEVVGFPQILFFLFLQDFPETPQLSGLATLKCLLPNYTASCRKSHSMHFPIIQETLISYINIFIRYLPRCTDSSAPLILRCICTDIIPFLIPSCFIYNSFHFVFSPLKQQKQSPISTHGSLSSIHRVFSDLYIYAYSQKSVLNCSGFTPDFIKLIFPNQTTPGYSFFQVYHFDKFMSINVFF